MEHHWIIRAVSEERSPTFGERATFELFSVLFGDSSMITIRDKETIAALKEKFYAQEPIALAFK